MYCLNEVICSTRYVAHYLTAYLALQRDFTYLSEPSDAYDGSDKQPHGDADNN